MQHLSHDDGNTANSSDRVAYQRVAQTVWGTRYIDDAVLRRWRRAGAVWPGPAAPMDPLDGGTWWYCTDARFSPVALLDAGGKVAERVRYDAYGNALHHHGLDADGDRDADSNDVKAINTLRGSWGGAQPLSIADAPYRVEYDLDRDGVIGGGDVLLAQSVAAAALPAGWVSASGPAGGPDSIVGYGGYIFNRETMYYTVRHRHYSPALGRFLERDPAGYVDGSNLVEYAGSNPVVRLDALGLEWTGEQRQAPPGMAITTGVGGGRACCDQKLTKLNDAYSAMISSCGYDDERTGHFTDPGDILTYGSAGATALEAVLNKVNNGIITDAVTEVEIRQILSNGADVAKDARLREGIARAGNGALRIVGAFGGAVFASFDATSGVVKLRDGDNFGATQDFIKTGAGLVGVVFVLTGPGAVALVGTQVVVSVVESGVDSWIDGQIAKGRASECDFLRSTYTSMLSEYQSECGSQ